MQRQQLYETPRESLVAWLQQHGEPAFRAKQIEEWVWKRSASSFDAMMNVGKSLQESLKAQFSISPLEWVKKERSEDGETTKYLWKLHDGHFVESVLIEAPGRMTVCVSSQVGCPVGCAFCASGRAGFLRNLTTAEIVGQVMEINRELMRLGQKVSHVVFMGMGEPLRNYEAVVAAIRTLIHPDRLGLSQRRITLSTVGVVEGIRALATEGIAINLAFSLHAPSQEVRKKIIPYARHYELGDILRALEEYRKATGRDITYEYILLAGINDSPDDAHALIRLIKPPCSVNLIPYNPVAGVALKRPETDRIVAFRDILKKGGIVTTCRFTKGRDIAAACGQLAFVEHAPAL